MVGVKSRMGPDQGHKADSWTGFYILKIILIVVPKDKYWGLLQKKCQDVSTATPSMVGHLVLVRTSDPLDISKWQNSCPSPAALVDVLPAHGLEGVGAAHEEARRVVRILLDHRQVVLALAHLLALQILSNKQ